MTFVRRFGILILGLVLLVFGLSQVVAEMIGSPGPSFEWTAYAPMTSTTFGFGPGVSIFWRVATLVGAALAAVWLGFRWNGRSASISAALRTITGYAALVIGVGLLVAAWFVSVSETNSAIIGTPAESSYFPLPAVLVLPQIVSFLLAVLGTGCIAGWIGFRVGRRRETRPN
jgi:hypothetical protein